MTMLSALTLGVKTWPRRDQHYAKSKGPSRNLVEYLGLREELQSDGRQSNCDHSVSDNEVCFIIPTEPEVISTNLIPSVEWVNTSKGRRNRRY